MIDDQGIPRTLSAGWRRVLSYRPRRPQEWVVLSGVGGMIAWMGIAAEVPDTGLAIAIGVWGLWVSMAFNPATLDDPRVSPWAHFFALAFYVVLMLGVVGLIGLYALFVRWPEGLS